MDQLETECWIWVSINNIYKKQDIKVLYLRHFPQLHIDPGAEEGEEGPDIDNDQKKAVCHCGEDFSSQKGGDPTEELKKEAEANMKKVNISFIYLQSFLKID